MGARPMERVIRENVKKPLADLILFGDLQKGGVAEVVVDKNGKKLKLKTATKEKTSELEVIK